MKQLLLFPNQPTPKLFSPIKGKRKTKRPMATRMPIHLILRATTHDLRKHENRIRKTWSKLSERFGIKTYRIVINADHIHAVICLHSQALYNRFIQGFTGAISTTLSIQWLGRPTTRIANWGRDFKRLCQYLKLNQLEAERHLEYQTQRTRNLPAWLKL